MYYRTTLPAFTLKERSYIFEKPHDPSAAGSLFVTVADSSTWEQRGLTTHTCGVRRENLVHNVKLIERTCFVSRRRAVLILQLID